MNGLNAPLFYSAIFHSTLEYVNKEWSWGFKVGGTQYLGFWWLKSPRETMPS